MGIKREKSLFRRGTFGALNFVYDIAFITLMLLLLLFAGYARWDSQQVYTQADPIQFIHYKPSPPKMMNFEELQGRNSDVMGWITIYGTNIDYPLVIGDDNEEYLTRNPLYEPTSSGALFLHFRNKPDFSDFNTIIFGHHMAHHEMFGDLDLFLDEEFWNDHEYGNLIFASQNHGIQFIAMLQCDAYDFSIYSPAVEGESKRMEYINHIYKSAKYIRGVETKTLRQMQKAKSFANVRTSPVTPDDHLILMSTCSADITNGRFILVAKLLDHSVENPFPDDTENKVNRGIDTAKLTARFGKFSLQTWIFILIILIILVLILYYVSTYMYKRKIERENGENNYDQHKENP